MFLLRHSTHIPTPGAKGEFNNSTSPYATCMGTSTKCIRCPLPSTCMLSNSSYVGFHFCGGWFWWGRDGDMAHTSKRYEESLGSNLEALWMTGVGFVRPFGLDMFAFEDVCKLHRITGTAAGLAEETWRHTQKQPSIRSTSQQSQAPRYNGSRRCKIRRY